MVISDSSEDDGKYSAKTDVGKTDLVGNQYVWIPVDKKDIVFGQHDYSKLSWPVGTNYTAYKDWKNKHYTGTGYENEMNTNIASVEKYGGFYIGRYEAGWELVTADTTKDMQIAERILKEAGILGANDTIDTTNYSYTLYYELTTGGAESTKVKNIYDLAGNMWEWTSEVGGRDSLVENSWGNNTQTFGVRRGGCLHIPGDNYPVSYRSGYSDVTHGDYFFGFRAMLYIK